MPHDEPVARGDQPAPRVERLQKVLAAAGVGSRRACEDLIARRRVTVDGRVARLGDKVDPTTAVIHVDGERVVTDGQLRLQQGSKVQIKSAAQPAARGTI